MRYAAIFDRNFYAIAHILTSLKPDISSSMSNNYDAKNIATMEMIYGEGYLSAGGDGEIARIVGGNLNGKAVLDVGCGLGGAVVTMARDLGADSVHGIDIDEVVLDRAGELVSRYGLESRVQLTLTEPGPLPLADAGFDLVHLTAVACHFDDLVPLFSEIHRVLVPGGVLVGRDWMKLNDSDEYRAWDDLLREKGLNFHFAAPDVFADAFDRAGFVDPVLEERTGDIAELSEQALERIAGDLRDQLLDVLGESGYADCLEWSRIRADALCNGGIGQYQFRAVKPA